MSQYLNVTSNGSSVLKNPHVSNCSFGENMMKEKHFLHFATVSWLNNDPLSTKLANNWLWSSAICLNRFYWTETSPSISSFQMWKCSNCSYQTRQPLSLFNDWFQGHELWVFEYLKVYVSANTGSKYTCIVVMLIMSMFFPSQVYRFPSLWCGPLGSCIMKMNSRYFFSILLFLSLNTCWQFIINT